MKTTMTTMEPTMDGDIHVQDLGVTLRTLLAVAGQGLEMTGRRSYALKYKGAFIGTVRVKPFTEVRG